MIRIYTRLIVVSVTDLKFVPLIIYCSNLMVEQLVTHEGNPVSFFQESRLIEPHGSFSSITIPVFAPLPLCALFNTHLTFIPCNFGVFLVRFFNFPPKLNFFIHSVCFSLTFMTFLEKYQPKF